MKLQLYNYTSIESIATSHAQNDAGLFELNFRDERYLPFEGAGAISRWRIELPKDNNAFDFDSITDVVLMIKYSTREGGEILRDAAKTSLDGLRATFTGKGNEPPNAEGLKPALQRLFSMRHEFPGEWHKFLRPATDEQQELKIEITSEHFPNLQLQSKQPNRFRHLRKYEPGFQKCLYFHLQNPRSRILRRLKHW